MSDADAEVDVNVGLGVGAVSREIEDLRLAGAVQFDPVQFHYLEVLARRAADHPAPVRRILDLRLAQAISTFRARLTLAQQTGMIRHVLAPAAPLPKSGALALLTSQVAQHATQRAGARLADSVQAQPSGELKSVAYFRATWSRLNTRKQVEKALDQAPRNAGPINSHGLVLKSLALMRDVSPDYLNRFVSYTQALLALDQTVDQTDVAKPAAARLAATKATPKKMSPKRVASRPPASRLK